MRSMTWRLVLGTTLTAFRVIAIDVGVGTAAPTATTRRIVVPRDAAWIVSSRQATAIRRATRSVAAGTVVTAKGARVRVRCDSKPARCNTVPHKGHKRPLCDRDGRCAGPTLYSAMLVTHIFTTRLNWTLTADPECVAALGDMEAVGDGLTADATDGVFGCDEVGASVDFGRTQLHLAEACPDEDAPAFAQEQARIYCELTAAKVTCILEGALGTGANPADLEAFWNDEYAACCDALSQPLPGAVTIVGCP